MRTVITVVLLAASSLLTAYSITALPYYDEKGSDAPLVSVTAGLWALFIVAVVMLWRTPRRIAAALVLAGSVAIGGAALAGPPNTSTDSARYAWDGIVQNAGISPYRYVPTDPALTDLRTDWLFPAAELGRSGRAVCDGERIMRATEPGTGDTVCTAINRADVPTIYPPTSELFFAGIRLLTGPAPEYWPLQLAGLAMSLGITAMLLRALTVRGRDPRWAALWGWCPLVATEGVTNSHVDLLGAVLLLAATLLVARGRSWWGGVALGAAVAVKLIPAIGAFALLRREPLKVIAASLVTFALMYVPYVLTTGIAVLGYLPGYLTEEGYETGERFILLSAIAPGPAAIVLAAVLLVITAGLVWWKSDPADPFLGQLVMIGVTLIVVTPRYPWYALLLIPFVALTGRWEWLAVALALTQRALIPSAELTRVSVTLAIVLIVIVSIHRAGPGALRRLSQRVRQPHSADAAIDPE